MHPAGQCGRALQGLRPKAWVSGLGSAVPFLTVRLCCHLCPLVPQLDPLITPERKLKPAWSQAEHFQEDISFFALQFSQVGHVFCHFPSLAFWRCLCPAPGRLSVSVGYGALASWGVLGALFSVFYTLILLCIITDRAAYFLPPHTGAWGSGGEF